MAHKALKEVFLKMGILKIYFLKKLPIMQNTLMKYHINTLFKYPGEFFGKNFGGNGDGSQLLGVEKP